MLSSKWSCAHKLHPYTWGDFNPYLVWLGSWKPAQLSTFSPEKSWLGSRWDTLTTTIARILQRHLKLQSVNWIWWLFDFRERDIMLMLDSSFIISLCQTFTGRRESARVGCCGRQNVTRFGARGASQTVSAASWPTEMLEFAGFLVRVYDSG